MHPHIHFSLVYHSQDVEAALVSVHRCRGKKRWTHTHTMRYDSDMTRNELLPFAATWVDLESIMLSNVSQKDKYHMILLTYRI